MSIFKATNRVDLRNKHTKKIKLLSLGLIFIGLFFYTSKLWTADTAEVNAVKQGQQIAFGNFQVELNQAKYYQDSDLLEAGFYIQHDINSVLPEVTVKAFNASNNRKLELKTEKIANDYYLIFFPNNQNYDNLYLYFYNKNNSDDSQETRSSRIYLAKNKANQVSKFTAKKLSSYQNEYINLLISEQKNSINELEKSVDGHNKKIEIYQKQSKELLENIALKTADEQQKINNQITAYNNSIDSEKHSIEEIEKEKATCLEKIEKLQSGLSNET